MKRLVASIFLVPILSVGFCLLPCGQAAAQPARVRASLVTNGIVWAGQKVTVVVELLAPGYFASAAAFDLPDPRGILLLPPLRHPEVSGEMIDGIRYTIQRHELVAYPLRAGIQSVPPISVSFNFKRNPLDTNEVSAEVTTAPLSFGVTQPPGAENLGQVISARKLEASESWQPEPGTTNEPTGAALTRTIRFAAPGVPGMVFPPFPVRPIDGLGIYTKRHVDDETEGGPLRGGREDVITYVCQQPGVFTIPATRFVWFDLETKQLRTNDFPARTLTVVSNPALHPDAAAPETAAATAGTRAIAAWEKNPGGKLTALILILTLVLTFCGRRTLRRITSHLWAWFRPVHLQPLNPTSPPPSRIENRPVARAARKQMFRERICVRL